MYAFSATSSSVRLCFAMRVTHGWIGVEEAVGVSSTAALVVRCFFAVLMFSLLCEYERGAARGLRAEREADGGMQRL